MTAATPVIAAVPAVLGLTHGQEILILVGCVVFGILAIWVAALLGRRSGRRAISQRLAALGTRLGLDPPQDEYNIETSLAYLEQVTGGAAQAVTESSSDAIRLRRSLDTLTQGVVLCDENGTVIYRNGRANALMVSRHGDALAAQAVTEVLEDAWHEGSAERTLDLYGPPRRTLQVRAHQIDDGRRPLGVIALIEDVSERRRLEEIRRDFVANVSHELKTPMGALGLLAETLVSEPDPEVAQRLAGRIHNEAFRVSRIIDDLLDLSRIESEEAPPREPVLVNLVMADAIERVRATADQRGLEIVLHEPSPPVAVMGDRRQLVSAMHALLENAITYSYDNSKVVVSGAVQRVNPNLSHASGRGEGHGDGLGFDTGEVILGSRGEKGETGDRDSGSGAVAESDHEAATGRGQGEGNGKAPRHGGASRHSEGRRRGEGKRHGEDSGGGEDTGGSEVSKGSGGEGAVAVGAVQEGPVEEPLPATPAQGTKLEETEADHEGHAMAQPAKPADGPVERVFTPEILENFTSPAETPAAAGTTVPPVASAAGPPAAPEGGEAVAVTETTSSIPNWRIEERDNVRISVQDHGVGIPARDLDRIFERFYRVDHGRSRDTGGTGLGLSIVRHVANNHQGWVDVESREGEGSTFTLVLRVQGQGERVV